MNEFEGILLVDKPAGMTSHDVVDRLRRKLQMRQIGHAGTLDPMATGLLVMLVGRATKVSQYLMSLDKVYEGSVKLGEVTDSYDSTGRVLQSMPVPEFSEEAIRAALVSFIGDQYQTPPMFSAKKIAGVPLYKMARKGKEIEREPKFIHVARFDLVRYEAPRIDFSVTCSKGTYVRGLAHDLGQRLGCGGHLCALRRTATQSFQIESAKTLDNIEAMSSAEIRACLIPVAQAVPSHAF